MMIYHEYEFPITNVNSTVSNVIGRETASLPNIHTIDVYPITIKFY